MTITLEHSLLEYFQSKNTSLVLYPEEIEKDFQGDFQYFYKFLKEQEEFWKGSRGGKCGQIYSHFHGIVNHLDQAIRYQTNNFQQAKASIDHAINMVRNRNWVNIYSETDIARFIRERYNINPTQADAAIDYFLIGQGYSNNTSNKEYLNGIIHCFIWDEQNNGLKRKLHAPKQALLQLKETFSKDRDELYGDFEIEKIIPNEENLEKVGNNQQINFDISSNSVVLMSPDLVELSVILPEPPQGDERILFITDTISARQCTECPSQLIFGVSTFQDAVLRLYGPGAGDQVTPTRMSSYTFADLNRYLVDPQSSSVLDLISLVIKYSIIDL